MELFDQAKVVRLRSHHNKYLVADEDEEHVIQDRAAGTVRAARWTVEFIEGRNLIRLKSCHGKYLTASNDHFLLGMTGKKVVQSTLAGAGAGAGEWEPVRDGVFVKLNTKYGTFLRANGGVPPWRNSVTHDVPHRTATQDWVLWSVDLIEIVAQKPVKAPSRPTERWEESVAPVASPKSVLSPSPTLHGSPKSSSPSQLPSKMDKLESLSSFSGLIPKPEGRSIYYIVANDNGSIDPNANWQRLTFIGTSIPELSERLREETMLDDIILCTRNPLNQHLTPLQLGLPPSNTTMRLVVVDANSRLGMSFFNV